MKKIYTVLFVLVLGSILSPEGWASHIMGMDMEYDALGNGVYQVKVTMYRDCSGIPAPSTLILSAFTPNGCTPFSSTTPVNATLTQTCDYPGSHLSGGATCEVTNLCDTSTILSCCVAGGNCLPGITSTTYVGVITLPTGTGGQRCTNWVLATNNCTRNATITNLSNPSSFCTYIYSELNDSLLSSNNSPEYRQRNQWVANVGQVVELDFGCIDPDGDSLAYRLVNPLDDWQNPIQYNVGFSVNSPFLVTAFGQSLHPATGKFTFIPSTVQNSVIAVEVMEYRDGVLIGTTRRDQTLFILGTTPGAPPVRYASQITGMGSLNPSGEIEMCAGDTAGIRLFLLDSFGNDMKARIHPDFSHPRLFVADSIGNGDSIQLEIAFSPSLSDSGLLEFVIQTWSNACPLKLPRNFTVRFRVPSGGAGFTFDTIFSCGDPVQLQGFGGSNPLWNPPTGLSNPTIRNPIANPPGSLLYTFSSSCGFDSFYFLRSPVNANFQFEVPCLDTMVQVDFTDSSSGSINIWFWQFSDGQVSTVPSPQITFSGVQGATYDATLAVNNIYGCTDTLTRSFQMDDDCVWPGDADKSKTVDISDLLSIGLKFGFAGPNRISGGNIWDAYKSNNWNDTLIGGTDIKHIDCNGDGFINLADTNAILLNLGLSHFKGGSPKRRFDEVPLFARIPQDTITNLSSIDDDDTVTVAIQLGVDTLRVDSIFGIAFSFHYQKNLIDSSTVHMTFDNSFFGQRNQNMIAMYRNYEDLGRVDVAIVGIDSLNRNGWGDVAGAKYVMQDDISGKTNTLVEELYQLRHEITNVRAITYSEMDVTLDIFGDTAVTKLLISSVQRPDYQELELWPNPTSDKVALRAEGHINSAIVYDLWGRIALQVEFENYSNNQTLDVSALPSGMYLIEVETSSGMYKNTLVKHLH